MALSLTGCGDDSAGEDEDSSSSASTDESVDGGDGDSSAGDGDSATGDGDGDSATGDGDGEASSGDGDGDSSGDGDADTGIAGCAILPADNPWNTPIEDYEVHANSDNYIASIGANTGLHADFGTVWDGAPNGIPYVVVDSMQPGVPLSFLYADESDPGPYPIPPDAPIEGGPEGTGDRHIIVLERDSCTLYEVYDAQTSDNGASWDAGSGATFDLSSNELRPEGWTSADAAGLPILPGLVTYEEVVIEGVIDHALRFTVSTSQRAYIHPATHWASSNTDPNTPPMGLRMRMKSDFDCSGLSSEVQVICTAFKTYGMYMADNGSDWYVSGVPDPRWSDDNLSDLSQIPGNAFEAVETGELVTP